MTESGFSSEGALHDGQSVCLEVADFVRDYGSDVRIGPINFSVREGEFFSLLGPSGCGKSTILRAIAGFENVDEGRIVLRGKPIHDKPANRRGVGLVFQRHALFPHLNVGDNVAFGLRLKRMEKSAIDRNVTEALELVGLSGMQDRRPSQLSGGQQQRVALARSLVLEPPVLLLDEPLSSLDLKLRIQMREEIRSLQSRLNKATIFVTHDQNEALSMSDRVAVLSEGAIEQIGTPREIYNTPATSFVAEFIGSSNRLHVERTEWKNDCLYAVTEEGLNLRVPSTMVPDSGSLLFVRPERIRIVDGHQKDLDEINAISANVVSEQYLGEDIQFRVRTECGAELSVAKKSTSNGDAIHKEGPCTIIINPDDIYSISDN